MKVGHVTERTPDATGMGGQLDTDEMDRAGIDLGATGRLQLMAKLAEGELLYYIAQMSNTPLLTKLIWHYCYLSGI